MWYHRDYLCSIVKRYIYYNPPKSLQDTTSVNKRNGGNKRNGKFRKDFFCKFYSPKLSQILHILATVECEDLRQKNRANVVVFCWGEDPCILSERAWLELCKPVNVILYAQNLYIFNQNGQKWGRDTFPGWYCSFTTVK